MICYPHTRIYIYYIKLYLYIVANIYIQDIYSQLYISGAYKGIYPPVTGTDAILIYIIYCIYVYIYYTVYTLMYNILYTKMDKITNFDDVQDQDQITRSDL